jgi:hypothetical protein
MIRKCLNAERQRNGNKRLEQNGYRTISVAGKSKTPQCDGANMFWGFMFYVLLCMVNCFDALGE